MCSEPGQWGMECQCHSVVQVEPLRTGISGVLLARFAAGTCKSI